MLRLQPHLLPLRLAPWHTWHTTGFFPRPLHTSGVFQSRRSCSALGIPPYKQVLRYGVYIFRLFSGAILVASSRAGPSIWQRFN